MKNLNIREGVCIGILTCSIALTTLTGCEATATPTEKYAIILGDNTATIISIEKHI